jgi:ATP-dependent Lon protease
MRSMTRKPRRRVEHASVRRRVKEQLKKIGGWSFTSSLQLHRPGTNEENSSACRTGRRDPDGPIIGPPPWHRQRWTPGPLWPKPRFAWQGGALSGLASWGAKEGEGWFRLFPGQRLAVSASIKPGEHDYHFHVVELHNSGPTIAMTLATFVALCSAVLGKPIQWQHEPGR